MKKTVLFLLLVTIQTVQGQLVVDNTSQTPTQIVQNLLLGNDITATNIKFNGSAVLANTIMDQVGAFSNGENTIIGLNSGILLATGNASIAVGPNNQAGASLLPAAQSMGDPDLALLTTGVVKNTSIIEFDFVPIGQNLRLNFVFASEEYLEFVNTNHSDVFGFFISGPGISGPYSGNAQNIAVLPNSTVPITIDTVNNLVNTGYYINNGTGSTPLVNTSIEYDGFLKVIAAVASVQCGQTYHIKLAIANVGDNNFDSAVFIEANSFNAYPTINLPSDLLVSNGLALCSGTAEPICTGLSNSTLHEWSLNGTIIAGATGSCVNISSPGELCVTVYPMGSGCPSSRCINVEFAQPINPTFAPIGPYMQNELPLNLPASSLNEISGTWSPATISTATVGTQTYTFTPDPDQCANVMSYDVTVTPQLDAAQFSTNTILIYPNPASDQLAIQLSAATTIKQIRLMDLLGRVLKTVNYSSAKKEEVLDLREIANGNYLLQVVSSNNQSEIKQIIVN
ncbi:MAG: hypothetical protein RIT03_1188 [Bacteroidota bacterium]|jgi:hypothetical protein